MASMLLERMNKRIDEYQQAILSNRENSHRFGKLIRSIQANMTGLRFIIRHDGDRELTPNEYQIFSNCLQ